MNGNPIRAIQRYYPQIYFACHVDHVRKASTAHALSSHDSSVLSHFDETRPITPSALARHIGVGPSTFSAQLDRMRVERLLARLSPGERLRAVEGMGLLAGAALQMARRAS
jgi:DNA-binding MarR family transcriptional regulator